MNTMLERIPAHAAAGAGELLATVEAIGRELSLDSLGESIATARRLLARPDRVSVAVLGSFKAGKSSLINALAGETLMPVAVVPATAIVTRIKSGPAARATVTFGSGECREVTVTDLAAWVTEEGNPRNAKNVAAVDVEAPGLSRFPDIAFLDTPGLGSVFAHNSETSLGYLPRLEAAIMAIPSTAPLSEADARLLARIAELTPRFAILLTKADLCSEEQRAEVRRFVERQLRQAGIRAGVHFWSQHPNFRAVREEFVRSFLSPLSGHAAEASREIVEHRIRLLALEAKGLLEAAAAAARRDAGARDALRTQIGSICEGPLGVPAILSRLEREACQEALPHALGVLEPEIPELAVGLRDALEVEAGKWRGSLSAAGQAYEQWLRAELQPRLAAISAEKKGRLAEPLVRFAANCEKLVADFHARVAETVRSMLGVTLSPPPWRPAIPTPRQPDLAVSAAFMFRFDWLWAVVPVALVRSRLRNHLRSRLRWEAEKNLSRIAAQWEGELKRRIAELSLAARQHIEIQQATIVDLLDRGGDALGPIEAARARLEKERTSLAAAQAEADDHVDGPA